MVTQGECSPTAGRPLVHVPTREECAAAATALGLRDTSVSDTKSSTDPPHCFYKDGHLLFNSNTAAGSYDGCSTTASCLCLVHGGAPCTLPKGTASPTQCHCTTAVTRSCCRVCSCSAALGLESFSVR